MDLGKKRSCETQLIITTKEIAPRLAKGKQVDVILLDFEKAFDKVFHRRLLYKLDHYRAGRETVSTDGSGISFGWGMGGRGGNRRLTVEGKLKYSQVSHRAPF